MSANDELQLLRMMMQELLRPDPLQPFDYYIGVRNECSALISSRFFSFLLATSSSLVQQMVRGLGAWTTISPVLPAQWKTRFQTILRRCTSENEVWTIVAQELQARNHRDCPAVTLPIELLSLVFDFLTLRDMARCTLVCKGWPGCTGERRLWASPKVLIRDESLDRSIQLKEVLQRSKPLPLHLTVLVGMSRSRKLLQVFSNCFSSRDLVSLEIHFSFLGVGAIWAPLLRYSMPQLRDLFLGSNVTSLQLGSIIDPTLMLPDSQPTSLYLHLVDPHGTGRDLTFDMIPYCFAQLTHLSLFTGLSYANLGRALGLVFASCHVLTDLTLLWLNTTSDRSVHREWASPPATLALKRLRIVLPSGDHELAQVVRSMRRNLPHLSVCIRASAWDRCCWNQSFFLQNAQTTRLTVIFCDPVAPQTFTLIGQMEAPAVLALPQLTIYNETPPGESFYIRTIGDSVYATEEVLRSPSRLARSRSPCEFGNLVSATIAEVFWDALAVGTFGSLPLLRSLNLLIASRAPGIYRVYQDVNEQPMLFSARMKHADVQLGLWKEPRNRAPYQCTCPGLETLRLVQDPHFANATGERAVVIEAWQVARFIGHQLGWASHETLDGNLSLRLVLQRVELAGRDPTDERQIILNHIVIEELRAVLVHENVETRWDRPYKPDPDVFV